MSLKENIGALGLVNPDFIEHLRVGRQIFGVLAKEGINILEISSSKATITLFLEGKDLEKALQAIKAVD